MSRLRQIDGSAWVVDLRVKGLPSVRAIWHSLIQQLDKVRGFLAVDANRYACRSWLWVMRCSYLRSRRRP